MKYHFLYMQNTPTWHFSNCNEFSALLTANVAFQGQIQRQITVESLVVFCKFDGSEVLKCLAVTSQVRRKG